MRSRFLLLAVALAAPVALAAQTTPPAKRGKDVEKFEVAGLPPKPASEIERPSAAARDQAHSPRLFAPLRLRAFA